MVKEPRGLEFMDLYLRTCERETELREALRLVARLVRENDEGDPNAESLHRIAKIADARAADLL